MADDEGHDEASLDPTFAASGPRRSTFTPPPASAQRPAGTEEVHDDDELANALAADLDRIASGPIPVVQPAPDAAEGPVAAAPEFESVIPDPTPTPPHYVQAPPAAAPPLVTPPLVTPPAWSSAPPPDPAQAVDLPDGSPQRPVRRSLPVEQLLDWADEAGREPGATLTVIEQIESQLKLREEEEREFRAWEHTMRALDAPDALDAVEQARPESAVADWPAPNFDDAAVAAPSASPESDDDNDEPVQAERPVFQAPAFEEPPFQQPPFQQPPLDTVPPMVAAPPPALPAWEVPAPSPTWSPGSDFDFDLDPEPVEEPLGAGFEPEIVLEPEPYEPAQFEPETPASGFDASEEPEPEIVLEPEPEPEEPEPGNRYPFAPPPFTPPPLVEPPHFGGPPILPSQASAMPPSTPPSAAFSFDDLVSGDSEEEPPRHPEPVTETDATPEALFIEPLPVAAGERAPTDTGSITVIDQAYEEELDDDVDEVDRVFNGLIGGPVSVDTAGIAVVAPHFFPPSGPISTVRIPQEEVVLVSDEPVRQRVFSLEESGLEPTPVDHRVGRAARLFWLWFAANSSILSLGLGAAIFAVGMSLRQSIVAVLAGVALSFIPLGLSTLAGKRSGQPTMVVSRATFGLVGNVVPALLALVTRLFWGAVLLWLLASSVAIVLVGAQLDGSLGERQLLLISLAVAFLVALLIAFAGYPLVARVQLILSIVSGALVIGLIALTAQYVNIPVALSTPDGPWVLTITGAVLVFSFVGLVWANSGADLARYQRVGSSGASSMLWATFGTTLPTFLLIGYGALLAASNAGIASGFLLSPLDTLTLMLPSWYPVPLLAATTLSLLSGITLSLYSGGFALQSVGVRVPRQWSIVIVSALLGGLALMLSFGVSGGINELFRDVATTFAVPTAAWAGIFAAETMIRNRRFESQSLLTRGGVYPDVRWANLVGLFLISAVGFALTTATVTWLSWQGYGFTLLGVPLDGDLAGTDVGVLVALVLGLLTPILTGIAAIRRQEATVV